MTIFQHGSRRKRVDFDGAIENAKRIYEEQLLPKYKDSHKGCHIVIDGISGDYEIGHYGHDDAVLDRLMARHPDAVTWSIPIAKSGFKDGGISPDDVEDIEAAIADFHRLRPGS